MSSRFEAMPLPCDAMFPATRYFEIDSVNAEARYAVWITTPKNYDLDPGRVFPAIYSCDGNRNMPLCADAADLSEWDLIDRFEPTIQISIGYTNEDRERALAVRARDLLPPQEPLPQETEDSWRQAISRADAGTLLDRAAMELYLHNLKNPAGDRFLAFLTEELHPFVASTYRIRQNDVGLFGHSYGGLFATYAALQPKTIFRNFCASSPGIAPGLSKVFALYADAAERGGLSRRNLQMTVASREITVPGMYQNGVGAGTVEFLRLAGSTPIRGLTVTSRFFGEETHITVKPAAFYGFLRAFYIRES